MSASVASSFVVSASSAVAFLGRSLRRVSQSRQPVALRQSPSVASASQSVASQSVASQSVAYEFVASRFVASASVEPNSPRNVLGQLFQSLAETRRENVASRMSRRFSAHSQSVVGEVKFKCVPVRVSPSSLRAHRVASSPVAFSCVEPSTAFRPGHKHYH